MRRLFRMKNSSIETAGKTVKSKSLVAMVTEALVSTGPSFKATGGAFVSQESVFLFMDTLFALSNVGRYDTMVTVDNVAYPISAYTVDGRIGKAFGMSKAVFMPGTNPYTKDLRKHEDATIRMTPAEFIEFQYQFLANFKVTPSVQPIDEFIRAICVGEVTEVSNGELVHIDDMCTVKSLPLQLVTSEYMYEDSYFMYPIKAVVKQIVVNFYTALKAKT
jgi:hypothetical protein